MPAEAGDREPRSRSGLRLRLEEGARAGGGADNRFACWSLWPPQKDNRKLARFDSFLRSDGEESMLWCGGGGGKVEGGSW